MWVHWPAYSVCSMRPTARFVFWSRVSRAFALMSSRSRIRICARRSLLNPKKSNRVSRSRHSNAGVTEQFQAVAELNNNIPSELISSLLSIDNPLQLAYSVATFARVDTNKAQALLEENSTAQKLGQLLQLLNKEHELLELGRKIQSAAQNEIEKSQREYYLREQMKAIQRELEEGEDQIAELDEFRQKIEESGMSDEARKEAERELDRLSGLSVASAEYGVIRTYLDWLTSMPWSKRTEDNLEVRHAREILNKDHYGLEDIKERILEFLAVRKLRAERAEEIEAEEADDDIRRTRQGAILLFVGPPGVGKTSLGASIARAMGRKFIRMSLGGVRDEAEIRGFRRTYIGAMPGRIVQTLRRAESRNPLIMLDEVDKLGRDFRGDPASALLELLDPEQNAEFRDTYLDVPFDLSEVFFITTANNLDTIPGAAARPYGSHPAQRVYRPGKAGHRQRIPCASPDQGKRTAPVRGRVR